MMIVRSVVWKPLGWLGGRRKNRIDCVPGFTRDEDANADTPARPQPSILSLFRLLLSEKQPRDITFAHAWNNNNRAQRENGDCDIVTITLCH